MLICILCFVILLPYLLFLKSVDDVKQKKEGLRMFGIYGFFGLPGTGKTMAMCRELAELRKKYGKDIYITTNFAYLDEDFPFVSWKDLLKPYDKPLIVAWDEVQNEFNSRDFKNFPIALLTQLTQVRKGRGIRIYYTSQRFHFVDKNFRSLSFAVSDCHTLLGRFTITKKYDILDYEELMQTAQVDKKFKIRPKNVDWFVQSDSLRNSYDSFKMLESAKSKEYMSREEISRLDKA